jgi:hypothetical protein
MAEGDADIALSCTLTASIDGIVPLSADSGRNRHKPASVPNVADTSAEEARSGYQIP